MPHRAEMAYLEAALRHMRLQLLQLRPGDEVERIDLALAFGEPTFMRTLEIVAGDMKIEKIVLAEEIKTQNSAVLAQIEKLFEGQNIEVEYVTHVELKAQTHDCKAVIRTGETTPYANIILQAGCIFA